MYKYPVYPVFFQEIKMSDITATNSGRDALAIIQIKGAALLHTCTRG